MCLRFVASAAATPKGALDRRDLDRCEPEQMLAVIESLRLFLDDEEMSRRLQVAMLIDRNILKRAIIMKGKKCGMLGASNSREEYFRLQEEKYFVTSLELAPLTPEDADQLAKTNCEP
jgi:hypothetical protein